MSPTRWWRSAATCKRGIPGSPVKANAVAAQEYYMRAAANYRNPNAQFEMGKMFLKGEGGVKASVRQAGRWFQLAAEKGHAGAQATLGNLLFQSGKVVRGLAMMTAALERAAPADQPWIRGMQEEAFALAGEADRRTAISLAQDISRQGQPVARPRRRRHNLQPTVISRSALSSGPQRFAKPAGEILHELPGDAARAAAARRRPFQRLGAQHLGVDLQPVIARHSRRPWRDSRPGCTCGSRATGRSGRTATPSPRRPRTD